MSHLVLPNPRMWFALEATRSTLRPGDAISADTVLGEDLATGKTLRAGVAGTVEAVMLQAINRLLVVTVRVEDGTPIEVLPAAAADAAQANASGQADTAETEPAVSVSDDRETTDLYYVDSARCLARAGEHVDAGALLGHRPRHGAPVLARSSGLVSSISHIGVEDVRVIAVRRPVSRQSAPIAAPAFEMLQPSA